MKPLVTMWKSGVELKKNCYNFSKNPKLEFELYSDKTKL